MKLKVLILSGKSNHNWVYTAVSLNKIINGIIGYKSTVEFAAINPFTGNVVGCRSLKNYSTIILNCNDSRISLNSQKSLENYISSGGGLVVYHSGSNAFPKWKEFNKMIGVGGWGGRDEKDGPELYLIKSKIVKNFNTSKAGYHGKVHSYRVNNIRCDHEILTGIPKIWLHAYDELYERMRGPVKNLEVLSSAYSKKKYGGLGREVPVIMTIRYNKGRIFHTTMGHVLYNFSNNAFLCKGFREMIRRGVLWCSGQEIKQSVFVDFPNKDTICIENNWGMF